MTETNLKLIAEKLEQAENLTIEIDPLTAFTLVGLMQLAMRQLSSRPGFGSRSAEELGRQVQDALGLIDPMIAEALETGWNPELDLTKEEFESAYPQP